MAVDSIVAFPDGLIGLGGSRFALLSTDAKSPFLWLQSLEIPTLALPVVNPHRFFSDYRVELADSEARAIGFDDSRPADVFVTVTAAPRVTDFTVNLKAPILIRDVSGYQLLNQAPGTAIKTPLFPASKMSARSG